MAKWINVRRKMPKPYQIVAGCTNSGGITICMWNGHDDWIDFHYDADFNDHFKDTTIAYWYPLPESPIKDDYL